MFMLYQSSCLNTPILPSSDLLQCGRAFRRLLRSSFFRRIFVRFHGSLEFFPRFDSSSSPPFDCLLRLWIGWSNQQHSTPQCLSYPLSWILLTSVVSSLRIPRSLLTSSSFVLPSTCFIDWSLSGRTPDCNGWNCQLILLCSSRKFVHA